MKTGYRSPLQEEKVVYQVLQKRARDTSDWSYFCNPAYTTEEKLALISRGSGFGERQ